jgi:hypothetical protein
MANAACEQLVLEEQAIDELIHQIRKFRWMGLHEEAMKAQAQLRATLIGVSAMGSCVMA